MAENEEASVLVYALEIVLEKDILGRDVDVPFLKEKVGLWAKNVIQGLESLASNSVDASGRLAKQALLTISAHVCSRIMEEVLSRVIAKIYFVGQRVVISPSIIIDEKNGEDGDIYEV